ncbi:MAG TPA: hypothetical protein VGN80_04805 [Devosiaceae bacterium]|jgi:hypothetical protein|nr:hypothetical protein [Devosiaceae bacterium]
MHVITGLFDTYAHASEAVHALHDAGIRTADISLIANDPEGLSPEQDRVGDGATAGAELGAVLGGAGGLLAGLGVLAIPGLGPVLAGGWLFAAAMGAAAGAGVGAATGGLIGALTGAGVPESDAHVYAEGVRRGGALVTVRAEPELVETAREILGTANGVDIADRRRLYESEGWRGFEPAESGEDLRRRPPVAPPPT